MKAMKAMKTIKFLSILAIAAVSFNSCSSDDDAPEPINEEEVITTMTVTLVPEGGGQTVTFQTRDLDGDGPNPPIITYTPSANLMANTTYTGSIELLNELEDPAEDITEEVAEEDDEHQFFFIQTGTNQAQITYLDDDADGNPVGLSFSLTTGDVSNNTLTVILRHEPNKNGAGVSEGNIANAGGDTDIETTFMYAVIN